MVLEHTKKAEYKERWSYHANESPIKRERPSFILFIQYRERGYSRNVSFKEEKSLLFTAVVLEFLILSSIHHSLLFFRITKKMKNNNNTKKKNSFGGGYAFSVIAAQRGDVRRWAQAGGPSITCAAPWALVHSFFISFLFSTTMNNDHCHFRGRMCFFFLSEGLIKCHQQGPTPCRARHM